jgi:pimeloyl-ACP methyl ester carboxylesterase
VPYLSIRDLRMYYGERGPADAQPVLLLNGAGGTIDDPVAGWAALAPAISAQFRTFLIEHRGHGRTNNPAGFMSFDQMADDIAGLVDELKLGAVNVLGISDGGVIALDLALRRASLIPTGRAFFQLQPLPAEIVLILGVLAGIWTWAVVHIHRTRIIQHGIDWLIAARGNLRANKDPA